MNEHLSDLALDGIRLGRNEGREHLDGCEVCQSRQAELAAADEGFDARFVPAQLAVATLTAAEAQSPRWPIWRFGFVSAGLAAVALLIVALPEDDLRTKGGGALFSLFHRVGGERVAVGPTVERKARLELRAEATGYLRVFWGTEAGEWTQLFPPAAAESWRVARPATWLPREVELDGAPETERIGVVVCETDVALAAARALLGGESRAGCRAAQKELRKR